ncbi:MAG: Lactate-binding periplasmic protein precursor [Syntrophorhabdus sp. PtaU1.Bin050]|nr:MAG: Lactate-binding periplasmic protein precursor [Syntrophorhabdus sp. PtaU1.Bin050]
MKKLGKEKYWIFLLVCFFLQTLLLGLVGVAWAQQKGKVVLRYASLWPEGKPGSIGHFITFEKPLLEEITKRTNGQVVFETYAGAALGRGDMHYDLVRTGKANMGTQVLEYSSGRFPLYALLTSPGWGDRNYMTQEVFQQTYDRIISKYEARDVKMLMSGRGNGPFYLYTSKKPVRKLEDLKGMKLRVVGGLHGDTVKALGGTPITMAITEVYQALQTGLLDGIVCAPTGLVPFKLWEVLKYETRGFNFGGLNDCIFMNLDTWNSLSNEHKQIIELVIRHQGMKNEVNLSWDEVPVWENAMDKLRGKGKWLITLTDTEAKRWVDRVRPLVKDYVQELESKKLPGKQTLNVIREECDKRGLPFPY